MAVLPLEVVGNVPAGRPALEAAVVRGLTMFTGTTVEATQTSARLIAAGAKLPCEDAACWTAVGKAVGTRHLVAGRVERKGAQLRGAVPPARRPFGPGAGDREQQVRGGRLLGGRVDPADRA